MGGAANTSGPVVRSARSVRTSTMTRIALRTRRRCSIGCSPRSTSRPTRSSSSTESVARSFATRLRGASPRRARVSCLAEEAVTDLAADRARRSQLGARAPALRPTASGTAIACVSAAAGTPRSSARWRSRRDISESRRVESVRRDFVANVSHELKTPIGALALLAETMAASEDARSSDAMRPRAQFC